MAPWWEQLRTPNGAVISPCGRYRLLLWRSLFDYGQPLGFHMSNPSKADATVSDPTIRRCFGFAAREGASGIIVTNLSPWRATDPRDLELAAISGEDVLLSAANEIAYRLSLRLSDKMILAWGANVRRWMGCAVQSVRRDTKPGKLWCLGTTTAGMPRHPLMLRSDAELIAVRGISSDGQRIE